MNICEPSQSNKGQLNQETNSPLVSILMPVYNSMDFARSGGFELLPKALDSLLSQSYRNFELIILDNQSTDNTSDICKSYARKDSRIRYILDSEKRFPEGAITYMVSSFMQGKYCMCANDDDLYHPEFIHKMVDFLENNPEIDMLYSNGWYIDLFGLPVSKIILQKSDTYNETCSSLSNYCAYIQKRNVIPIIFGFFRADSYRRTLPFENFDDLKANVDNLFIAKFFLMGGICHFIDEELFFYRAKKRGLSEVQSSVKIDGMPNLDEPLLIWMYYIRHQFYFLRKLDDMICDSKLSDNQYIYVKCLTFHSFIKHSLNLLVWIRNSYIHKRDDKKLCFKILNIIDKKFRPFYSDRLNVGFSEDDKYGNVKLQPPVIAGLLDVSLKSNIDLLELIKYYNRAAKESKKSEIIEELEELLQEEISMWRESKSLIELEIGRKPEILVNTEEKIGINDETPTISVISPSLNLARFLEETIRSVANQSFRSFEHIVIDGGSTDETLNILKRYPHIKWFSEKDSGVEDAIRKALAIARGKYVMSCCISDGYLSRDWFKLCVEVLDSEPDVSLVWGFPQYLTEDSKLGLISYPQFHHSPPPQKHDFVLYWLKTAFWLPEGNFCVRREVFDKCFPSFEEFSEYRDCFLEFNYKFNSLGYLPYHVPVVASFGRTHNNQGGEKEKESGLLRTRMEAYFKKVRHYRWKLLTGLGTHVYRDGEHNVLSVKFSNENLRREYIAFIACHLGHLIMGRFIVDNFIALAKKYLPLTFLTKVKRVYRRVV